MITLLQIPSSIPNAKRYINLKYIVSVSGHNGYSRITMVDGTQIDISGDVDAILSQIPRTTFEIQPV